MKRAIVASALAVAALATALAGYLTWIYAPWWPWGTVVKVERTGWVVVQSDDGTRYRGWVPESDRGDAVVGELMTVRGLGPWRWARRIPW